MKIFALIGYILLISVFTQKEQGNKQFLNFNSHNFNNKSLILLEDNFETLKSKDADSNKEIAGDNIEHESIYYEYIKSSINKLKHIISNSNTSEWIEFIKLKASLHSQSTLKWDEFKAKATKLV
jgi:hypothetical protein